MTLLTLVHIFDAGAQLPSDNMEFSTAPGCDVIPEVLSDPRNINRTRMHCWEKPFSFPYFLKSSWSR